MKSLLITVIVLVILTNPSFAYPPNEMGTILKEKYPDADFRQDIIIQSDERGIYIKFNRSTYPIPDATEMETLWQIVKTRRILEAQNQTEKLLSRQDLQTKYQNQIDNLNTVVNNSNYIQAKTNWTNADIVAYMKVLARNDEVQAKGQIAILKILRWILW